MPDNNARFHDWLIARKRDIIDMESGDRERTSPVELDQTKVGRLSRMDAIQGQEMSAAVKRRREVELRRIESALARLKDGDFGFCLSCGEEIPIRRLEVDPAASQCASCASGGADSVN